MEKSVLSNVRRILRKSDIYAKAEIKNPTHVRMTNRKREEVSMHIKNMCQR